jgi:hypothetical protein
VDKRLQVGLAMGCLVASIVALSASVHRNRLAEVELVKTNVESLRTVMLAREDSLGDAPRPCGKRETAQAAFEAGKRDFGACGVVYFGRTDDQGPYWVEVAPGGTDFTVHGFAETDHGMREITASRVHQAQTVTTP